MSVSLYLFLCLSMLCCETVIGFYWWVSIASLRTEDWNINHLDLTPPVVWQSRQYGAGLDTLRWLLQISISSPPTERDKIITSRNFANYCLDKLPWKGLSLSNVSILVSHWCTDLFMCIPVHIRWEVLFFWATKNEQTLEKYEGVSWIKIMRIVISVVSGNVICWVIQFHDLPGK